MPLLVVGRRRELDDANVARVELGDKALDRTALPACVPALEEDAERRTELPVADLPAQGQPELGEPGPCSLQPLLLLLLREGLGQVDFGEAAHLRTSGIGTVAIVRQKAADRQHDQEHPGDDRDRRARGLAPGSHEEARDHHDQERKQVSIELAAARSATGRVARSGMPPFSLSFARMQSVAETKSALEAVGYLADEPAALVSYLAEQLGKPVLVEGPAGVGKTELAKAISRATGRELIRLQCYEGLDEAKALYEWNYRKQLLHIQAKSATEDRRPRPTSESARLENEIFSEEFILTRPLLVRSRTPSRSSS